MTNNHSKLVSIITPYRDAQLFLPDLVNNLLRQVYQNWECLLVDHWSTDKGTDLLTSMVDNDDRFRLLSVPYVNDSNAVYGPSLPRNIGLSHARGELICFLDVDDLWHPQKLERQVSFHLSKDLDLSVTSYYRWYSKCPSYVNWYSPPIFLTPLTWRSTNPIPMLTAMVSRPALIRFYDIEGKWFDSVRHEDYLFWLKLSKYVPNLRYACLFEGLAIHRRLENNLTSFRLRMPAWAFGVFIMLAGLNTYLVYHYFYGSPPIWEDPFLKDCVCVVYAIHRKNNGYVAT